MKTRTVNNKLIPSLLPSHKGHRSRPTGVINGVINILQTASLNRFPSASLSSSSMPSSFPVLLWTKTVLPSSTIHWNTASKKDEGSSAAVWLFLESSSSVRLRRLIFALMDAGLQSSTSIIARMTAGRIRMRYAVCIVGNSRQLANSSGLLWVSQKKRSETESVCAGRAAEKICLVAVLCSHHMRTESGHIRVRILLSACATLASAVVQVPRGVK